MPDPRPYIYRCEVCGDTRFGEIRPATKERLASGHVVTVEHWGCLNCCEIKMNDDDAPF